MVGLAAGLVFARSTIPKDPRSVSDRTLRHRLPDGIGATFFRFSFPNGFRSLAATVGLPSVSTSVVELPRRRGGEK